MPNSNIANFCAYFPFVFLGACHCLVLNVLFRWHVFSNANLLEPNMHDLRKIRQDSSGSRTRQRRTYRTCIGKYCLNKWRKYNLCYPLYLSPARNIWCSPCPPVNLHIFSPHASLRSTTDPPVCRTSPNGKCRIQNGSNLQKCRISACLTPDK